VKVWIAHQDARDLLGALPEGVTLEVLERPEEPPSDPSDVEFWVPPFLSKQTIVDGMTGLRVVQLLSAGAEVWVGRLRDSVTLCDGRGVHDSSTSEWAMTAMLAYVRNFHYFVREQSSHRWSYTMTDELAGKHVLIVGAGSIGEALAARLAPFDVTVTRVARRARDGVHGVEELPSLLPAADIVVLILPLTDATRGMVDAKFLAAMHDGALLVNAARGPVADTAALTAELATDVTDPEPLPPDHPLWHLPNVLLTPHVGGSVRGFLRRGYALAGEQLRRYAAGRPLENVVTEGY
jgi:phosphoglycerate dehydrogenase-like enzyme